MLKKLDPTLHNFIKKFDNLNVTHTDDVWHELIPINDKLKRVKDIHSKEIRNSLSSNPSPTYKLLNDCDPNKIRALGIKLAKVTNVKLKAILLRSIHGDIYSGTRLKKFGMVECDKCPRCNEPETVEHQLFRCAYCKKLWATVSRLTGISNNSMDALLGLDEKHNTATITIHSEIIRRLLAIERPTGKPIDLIKSSLSNLSILERGTTRYQISTLRKQLEIIYLQESA